MVVQVPNGEAPGPWLAVQRRSGRLGQQVVAVHRAVERPEGGPIPAGIEHAFHGAALVTGVRVDRSPPPGGPANDLDLDLGRVVEGVAIAVECPGRALHDRYRDEIDTTASHAGGPYPNGRRAVSPPAFPAEPRRPARSASAGPGSPTPAGTESRQPHAPR